MELEEQRGSATHLLAATDRAVFAHELVTLAMRDPALFSRARVVACMRSADTQNNRQAQCKKFDCSHDSLGAIDKVKPINRFAVALYVRLPMEIF